MPLYEYKCDDCGHRFEKLVGLSAADEVQECPACGATACQRQYSAFASNVKKGSFTGGATDDCGSCSSSSRFT
jgi:putative FmdB family regulatory protein